VGGVYPATPSAGKAGAAMTASLPLGLFGSHLHAVWARIGLQGALGGLLADLPARRTEAEAVRTAWLGAIKTSGEIRDVIILSEHRGNVIPFRRRLT